MGQYFRQYNSRLFRAPNKKNVDPNYGYRGKPYIKKYIFGDLTLKGEFTNYKILICGVPYVQIKDLECFWSHNHKAITTLK